VFGTVIGFIRTPEVQPVQVLLIVEHEIVRSPAPSVRVGHFQPPNGHWSSERVVHQREQAIDAPALCFLRWRAHIEQALATHQTHGDLPVQHGPQLYPARPVGFERGNKRADAVYASAPRLISSNV
jgi:hypothetical protein